MRRETQNLLLLLLGGALLKSAFSGTYLHYVKPSLFPWLVAAGAVTVLLAVAAILRDVRTSRVESKQAPAHSEHGSRSPWMLLLPVFAIFLVAPPALGADSVGRAGDPVAPPRQPEESRFEALPPGATPPLQVSEFVTRAVWDTRGSLNGRAVRLQGFVTHPGASGEVQLARMRITCCAADASPAKVDLAGPEAALMSRLPADTWVEVTGTLQPGTATEVNDFVPSLAVDDVRRIPPPANPYEY